MSKKLTKPEHLPAWFRLSKYDDAKLLSPIGWRNQLQIRKRLGADKNPSEDEITALKALWEKPIWTPADGGILSTLIPEGGVEAAAQSVAQGFPWGVRPPSIMNFYRQELPWGRSNVQKARRFIDNLYYSDDAENQVHQLDKPNWTNDLIINWWGNFDDDDWPHLNKAIQHDAELDPLDITRDLKPLVEVNLELNNDLLIKDFKKCVEKLRKNQLSKTGKTHKPNFNDWIHCGLLPCFDLDRWAKLNDVSISNNLIATAACPIGECDAETIRKTTRKILENSVFESKTLDALITMELNGE